ncbi:hypothetical protein FSP39_004691 [Pinctada imbricata]|uniref:Protein XRP2 n=1 Tax=Pinctada imbricata TaxID=66713 RepID=A0AA88YH39_PINIB|nr:hypothetical protein FSP39_004691 [Pinctada imbricata]
MRREQIGIASGIDRVLVGNRSELDRIEQDLVGNIIVSRAGKADRPRNFDPKDFIIEDQKDVTVGRVPGKVNGQQFVIQNCENCNIYIFDHIATVTIDNCTNCNIFLGPIKTSVFIRTSKNCNLVVACQQFRTRDCNKINIFLFCGTQPIIEASSGMKFACFQYHYPQLEGQFKSAGLSVFSNTWGTIHDFDQDPSEQHYSNLPEGSKVEDFIPLPQTEDFSSMVISTSEADSVVPLTLGTRRKISDESCLIVFFNDGNNTNRALNFLDSMSKHKPGIALVQTKELDMKQSDAVRVFGTDSFNAIVERGPVIGLEFNGDGCVDTIQNELQQFMQGMTGLVFVSQSAHMVEKQLEDFYNFADMQMAI